MNINEIKEQQSKIYLEAELVSFSKRIIESTKKQVFDFYLKDNSGKVEVSIFKETDPINIQLGEIIRVESAFCKKIFEGMPVLTTGFYGSLMAKRDNIWTNVFEEKKDAN